MNTKQKISALIAICTVTGLSYLNARPTTSGMSHEANKAPENNGGDAHKALLGKAAFGEKEGNKSQAAAMAGMAGMANSQDSDSGSGSSDSSGAAPSSPTTSPTPAPTNTPEPAGQQYAPAPNTGVPTTVNAASATPAPTPTSETSADKGSDKTADNNKNNPAPVHTAQEEMMAQDQHAVIQDQDSILEKIKEINAQDDKAVQAVNDASMALLFNNFVYFKDFIVQNFSKDKMLSLCVEFINQIYPTEHVKIIAMNNAQASNQPTEQSSSSNQDDQSSDHNEAMQSSPDNAPDFTAQNSNSEEQAPDMSEQMPDDLFNQDQHNDNE